jgi:ubiquitin-like 1-activating enzyme E1 B
MARLAPHLRITSHESNVYDLPLSFFRQFGVVIMALDNVEARTFVNAVCVRLGVLLLDAGTAGYSGQARLIHPGETACYSCQPKSTAQKTYPTCTIRNRPK